MLSSHGRGGAGNMADSAQSPKANPADFQTPTLKSSVVTTGRGGTGNMAKNDDPRETRKRQDVEAVPRRPSAGAQHAGRGGAGNIFKDNEAELNRKASDEEAISEEDEPASKPAPAPAPAPVAESLAQKGKNWLFGKKA
ncbi:hypothetical protein FALBO_11222 [Fusarium albosuccineum]|uniref:Uncharacterized protein n=1 Tax=Fusarium albosuccineum TaxID=1237068 RepID=A0A8H4L5K6_9HYPO|nr:hypothetical protein FALBO_11222 [Fusarium albosuccineum]